MKVLLQIHASLWNQKQQLEGTLILTPESLHFAPQAFEKSHLRLNLALKEIADIQAFLVYGIAFNGLKITGKDGHFDLFVLEDPLKIKKLVGQAMQIKKKDSDPK